MSDGDFDGYDGKHQNRRRRSAWRLSDECQEVWVIPRPQRQIRPRSCVLEWKVSAPPLRQVHHGELTALINLNNQLERRYQALIDSTSPQDAEVVQKEIDHLEEKAAELIRSRTGRRIQEIRRRHDEAVSLAEQLLANANSSEDHQAS